MDRDPRVDRATEGWSADAPIVLGRRTQRALGEWITDRMGEPGFRSVEVYASSGGQLHAIVWRKPWGSDRDDARAGR